METMVLVKVDLMSSLSIGEVARRSGKAASAIRYYESIGLLPPARRESGRRFFPEETVRTLHVIDTARSAGLTLEEIRKLLAGGEPLRSIAGRRLAELDAQRTWLVHAADCTCVDLDDCALFA
jgi:MerR family transcriptional regulator, redox-sensitive transcriptional activator SoxR